MMASPQTPFDMMRSAATAPLSPIERTVLKHCERAASAGEPAPSIEQLSAIIGANGVSTVPGIMKRLEAKGYISRTIYQRGRVVCISATGQCTAPPPSLAPHWRTRSEQVPSPAIQSVRDKCKSVSAMIEAEARQRGCSLAALLADLTYIGWHQYIAEKETGE